MLDNGLVEMHSDLIRLVFNEIGQIELDLLNRGIKSITMRVRIRKGLYIEESLEIYFD